MRGVHVQYLSLRTYCVGCMSNSQVFNWVSCRESWFFKRENSGINFPPNEICIGSLIVGSVLQHYRYKMTHPNLLGQKFPEHSLNINLIEKLEEETNYFNKLHDAHFVKWWWANLMNTGLNHNGGCTIIMNQSYNNFYSHFGIPYTE